ncbi:MAG: hypothetical protein ACMUJM_13995 [bacterium]
MKKNILISVGIFFLIFSICGSATYAQGLYFPPYPLIYPLFNPYYAISLRSARILGGTTALLLSTLLTPTTTVPITTIPTLLTTVAPAPAPTTPLLGTLTIAIALAGGGGGIPTPGGGALTLTPTVTPTLGAQTLLLLNLL